MKENFFKKQIEEDIRLLQFNYGNNNPLLVKDDYAFNYWILTKLFNVDEELVDSNITEYSDDGVDCFVFFEESKELYIIQNKYYSTTKIDRSYVQKDFLYRPLSTLVENNYRRSKELQEIFNKYKNDSGFKIYLYFYVTNDLRDNLLMENFAKFQNPYKAINCYIEAKLFYLTDIKEQYYEDRKIDIKNFSCDFLTVNDGTFLNIDKHSYPLPNLTDAKYILTPVKLIYKIVKEAYEKNYMLFEENIREYLGNKGVNAKIAKTLENDNDRENFFYYNNGITVICDSVKKEGYNDKKYKRLFRSYNPQIVNGCQTVNTIYEVLKKYPDEELEEKFENTFVMVKLLVLNKDDEKNKNLYQDIVKYNNSQNAITEKNFAANQSLFMNMKRDFKKRGLLLAVKQSDNYTLKTKEKFNDYRPLLSKYEENYGLTFSSMTDIIIPLEKLLQVLLAFSKDGYYAFTKKSEILKIDNTIYNHLIDYIKNSGLTTDDIIKVYMLFVRAEIEKKESDDKRTPIPYYLLGFIGNELKNLCYEEFREKFDFMFSTKETIDSIYKFYKVVTKRYKQNYKNAKDIEYNQMIKSPIDTNILYKTLSDELDMIDSANEKRIIKNYRDPAESKDVICV